MMSEWINVTINDHDEVLLWVHQKYEMIWIVQKIYSTGKIDTLTLLLPMVFDYIGVTMNKSDYERIFEFHPSQWQFHPIQRPVIFMLFALFPFYIKKLINYLFIVYIVLRYTFRF